MLHLITVYILCTFAFTALCCTSRWQCAVHNSNTPDGSVLFIILVLQMALHCLPLQCFRWHGIVHYLQYSRWHWIQRMRSHLQMVPSSQTEMRMLPSRVRWVCRIAAVHLLWLSVVHLNKEENNFTIKKLKRWVPKMCLPCGELNNGWISINTWKNDVFCWVEEIEGRVGLVTGY